MVWNALKFGLICLVVVPLALAFAALGIGHMTDSCGAGSSGACEMGAASVWLITLIPCFVIGAVISVVRDLLRKRA